MSEVLFYLGEMAACAFAIGGLASRAVAKLCSEVRELRVRLEMVKTRAGLLQERFDAAEARAREAEGALAAVRMKRSQAVSKGNRTRAERERARILKTTEAVRQATRAKRKPQGDLPL